jgi:adenine-specific DNA-methyltransferase
MDNRYRNPDNHKDGPWKATPLYAKRTPTEKESGFSHTFKNGVVWTLPPGTSPRFPVHELQRMDANDEIWFGADGKATPARKTFLERLTIESPPSPTIWLHSEAGNNHEAREESKFVNDVEVFGTPKPEKLLKRIFELASLPNDLVLDSFLGSGTTAAVAHKMGRRWIGIESGEHAVTHCLPRLKKVVDGEQGGISTAVNWQGGGGFRFMQLGAPMFAPEGDIDPGVRYADLAAFIWMRETGSALDTAAQPIGLPLIGLHATEPGRTGTAYYLLFNGILGDRRPASGNVLTSGVLDALRSSCWHAGPKVVYGEACRLGEARLAAEAITFKQLPHAVPR